MNKSKILKRLLMGLAIGLFLLIGYIVGVKVATDHQQQEQTLSQLQNNALNLLGFLQYEQGTFKIPDTLRSEAKSFIEQANYPSSLNIYLASIYDLNNDKMIWSSTTLQDNSNILESKLKVLNTNLLATSEFQQIRQAKDKLPQQNLLKTEISDGLVDYKVGIQFFNYPNRQQNNEYAFVSFINL